MAKPVVTVPPWGTAGNYPVGFYPLFYPWGQPNPVGGSPYPWNNQPRLNAAGLVAFAAAGTTPQIPSDASSFNEWLNRVGNICTWVEDGSNGAAADAHIMETNGAGLSSALAYEATSAFQGVGGTPAPLPNGANIDAGMTLTLTGNADIAGGVGSKIVTEKAQAGIFEVTSPGLAPTVRQFGAGTNDRMLWNDGNVRAVHTSTSEFVYATGDQEAATGLAATTNAPTTTVRLLPRITANVRIIAEGWGQRSSPGAVTISLEADDGIVTWSTVGATQTSTWVDQTDANLWSFWRIERVFAAGLVVDRLYRAHITGGGGNTAKIREASIRVVMERS